MQHALAPLARERARCRRQARCAPTRCLQRLYKIEDEIRDLDPDAKLVERQARSKPVWDQLAAWCELRKQHEPPASKLGVALRYFTNHQVALAARVPRDILPRLTGGIRLVDLPALIPARRAAERRLPPLPPRRAEPEGACHECPPRSSVAGDFGQVRPGAHLQRGRLTDRVEYGKSAVMRASQPRHRLV
jgi:hypothetical protein